MKRHFLLLACGFAGGVVLLEGALRLPSLWQHRHLYYGVDGGPDFSVLALGESTTQGGPTDSYPIALGQLLLESCPRSRLNIKNAGLAGARSDDIRRDVPELIEEVHPDAALIMMGINDIQGTGGPVGTVGRSRWRVVRLVKWLFLSFAQGMEPEPKAENAAALGKLDRWSYYRIVTQKLVNEGRASELESIHRTVLKAHPESHAAKIDLGILLRGSGRAQEALMLHQAALDELPEDAWVLWEILLDQESLKYHDAVAGTADRLIGQAQGLPMPIVTELAELLDRRQEFARRDRLLSAAASREQAQAILQWLIASAREKSGNEKEAELARSRAKAAASAPYPVSLAENYQAIVRELRESGAVVYALTYPRQPLAPLAALFAGHEVELVSLEEPFNEAVKKEGYGAIFYDSFGGNFGHLTERGNRLLALLLRERLLKDKVLGALCR